MPATACRAAGFNRKISESPFFAVLLQASLGQRIAAALPHIVAASEYLVQGEPICQPADSSAGISHN